MYDVIIIGGRVAGARIAGLLAKKDAKVLLIDSRKNISKPVQCTGFVSHRLLELLPNFPKRYVHNSISKAKFYSPSKRFITLTAKPFVVINRGKLDDWLLDKAKKYGVKIETGVTFKDKKIHKDYIEVITNKSSFKSKLLIGADGPASAVANSCGIKAKPQFYGVQATVKGKFDNSCAELYFGSKVAPKYFAWVVPIDKVSARIGLATKSKPYNYFKTFTKEKLGYIPKPDVAGGIKCNFQNRLVSDRIVLIGDAASQVKPFSGGGIAYSLIASELCAHAVAVALKTNRFDYKSLKRLYQDKAHKKLKSPIKRGLLIYHVWHVLPDFVQNAIFLILNRTKFYRLAERMDPDFY